jgi:hypothetical protein
MYQAYYKQGNLMQQHCNAEARRRIENAPNIGGTRRLSSSYSHRPEPKGEFDGAENQFNSFGSGRSKIRHSRS